ncbi:protein RADIALIS-like 4 isoform X2 [Asparagus officinalis]|uniref:protein RADIALIS-like 4 isoform X2 n=1 Tax=Asparagus officinalis TaxID=4686 RepID=UPI00098E73B6|nr:protein RADIALIS-like 4 isoform X2 [Asparagus officinalis]
MDFCGWSWEENKLFEMALAVIDEDNPDRWKEIISVIGGKRSEEEVKKHYEALLRDLNIIESGMFDQEFGEAQDCTQDITLTGDEQNFQTC